MSARSSSPGSARNTGCAGWISPEFDTRVAIVVPEAGIELTYRELRDRAALADEGVDGAPDSLALLLSMMAAARPPMTDGDRSTPAHDLARRYGLDRPDVCLCIAPLSIAGGFAAALSVFASGGTLVLPASFNPLSFWRIARDQGVTWIAADAERLQWLLARAADPGGRRPAGAAKLRFIASCGAALPPRVRRALETAFGVDIKEL